MTYTIKVFGYASEFSVGSVKDKKLFELLKNNIVGEEEYDISSNTIEDEDGCRIDIRDINDVIHNYRAWTDRATISIDCDENCDECGEYDAYYFDSVCYLNYNYYGYLNKEALKKEGILAFSESVDTDEGWIAEYELETENFNPKYLRIANIIVDEYILTDYLLDALFYISDEDLLEIYNKEAEEYNKTQGENNWKFLTLDDLNKDREACLEKVWELIQELCFKYYKYPMSLSQYRSANYYTQDEFSRIFGDYILCGDSSGFDTFQRGGKIELGEL